MSLSRRNFLGLTGVGAASFVLASPLKNLYANFANGKSYDALAPGGTTTVIVDSDRKLQKHFISLAGTSRNCGGGYTPWNSWISCV